MYINNKNYRLTKHGRARYLERVDSTATDSEIIRKCVGLKQAVWKRQENVEGLRLVTVLPKENKND